MFFGVVSASEIYCKAMELMLEGLDSVKCYINDIIVWGSSKEEHGERLEKVLNKIRQSG